MLHKKSLLLFLTAIVLFTLFAAGCGTKQEQEQTQPGSPNDSVAIVNGETVTRGQFDEMLDQAKTSYQLQGVDFATEEGIALLKGLEQQVLDYLINNKVLMQEIGNKGYGPSTDEINSSLAEIQAQYESEEQFQDALSNANLSVDQLKEMLSDDLALQKYMENEIGEIPVTEEDIEELYELYSVQIEEMPDLEEIKELLTQEITEQKQQEKLQAEIEALREKSTIQILI